MRRLLTIIILLIFLSPLTYGQLWKLRRLEITGGIGTTQFYGDIGGYPNNKNILGIKDFSFKNTRYNVNAGARYKITEDVAARINLVAGIFHSTDAAGSKVSRGYESQTTFIEPSLIAEYYFIKNKAENSFLFQKNKHKLLKSIFASLDFYAFAGFGGLSYMVKPNDYLDPYVVHSSGLTGVVPLGIGVNMLYSGTINFGLEFGGRFTFSDNIDGFTSDLSRANDIYHMVNFTVTYKIKTGK